MMPIFRLPPGMILVLLFGIFTGPASADPELSEAEQAWLAQGQPVRVRVSQFPPFHFQKDGRAQGISVEILDRVAERYGLNLIYVHDLDWPGALEAIAAHRKFDVLLTAKHTAEREARMAFTADYLSMPWVVITRKDSPFVSGEQDLAGRSVAVESGYLMQRLLREQVPEARLLPVDGLAAEALTKVSTGVADAYVGNLTVAAYEMVRLGLTNLRVAAPTSFGAHTQAMAVRNDWPELVSILNRGLAAISPGQKNRIFQGWLSVRYDYGLDPKTVLRWVVAIGIPLLALLASIAWWSRRLRREVEERRRVEGRLLQSEERYRDLFSCMPSGVAVYQPLNGGAEFIFTDFNHAAERINQTSRDAVIGKGLTDLFPGVHESGLIEVFQRVNRSGEPERHPITIYHDERLHQWVENYVYRLSDGSVVAIHDDVTEAKRLEIELHRRTRSLAKAQAIAHVGNWDWDIASGLLIWTDEIFRIFGLSPQEFKPTYAAFLERVHPEDREALETEVRRALQNPTHNYYIEHRVVRPDGAIRQVTELGEIERDAAGEAVHMTGTVQDITERKKAETQLLLAAKIIENASEGIVVTDVAGLIVDANPAYERILGYPREQIIGKKPGFASSGHHDEGFYREMWQRLRAEGAWEGEIWDRHASGATIPQWLTINAITDPGGRVTHYVGMLLDISSQKAAELKLKEMAFYDPLTELPNRTLFHDRLEQQIATCHRNGSQMALMFIDLDRFKGVNDTLGHAAGDQLLQETARRLRNGVREADTVARLGGDEFTIIVTDVSQSDGLSNLAGELIKNLCKAVELRGQSVHVGASIGIALYPEDGRDAETLLKNADIAMYQAKDAGRNTFQYFSPAIQAHVHDRVQMEADLNRALERDELRVHYQPKFELSSCRLVGMEALVRWEHPSRGLIGPGEFIPLAEETGLILALGEWVLREASREAAHWLQDQNVDLKLAVNLSARQFLHPDLVESVGAILRETGLPPRNLELEITESMVMANIEQAIVAMQQLRDLGISLAIDDFGTGYSSLSHLKRFPINTLKIDQSFVRDIARDAEDDAIVDAIISLARSLKMEVIAEGIETEQQLDFLRRRHCMSGQGFLLGRPAPSAEFAALCSAVNRPPGPDAPGAGDTVC